MNPRVGHAAMAAGLILILGAAIFALLNIWQGF